MIRQDMVSYGMVVKLSVSDMEKSLDFYTTKLGFKVDERYTINANKDWGMNSYVQLVYPSETQGSMVLGLYKDITAPFPSVPANGSVPSFLVGDVEETYEQFKHADIGLDSGIIPNTSDKGYTDHFFFFHDPDNNSLVIRQNMPHNAE